MSAIVPADRRQWWAPQSDTCLYCHDPVPPDQVAVNWLGAEHIILHPDCATSLGTHLIMDSRGAQLASGRQPWTRRMTLALRSALQAEEARR
jgi:hypothetical protein